MEESPGKTLDGKKIHIDLRVNRVRVLLTRGRDGFIIFVPPEIGMQSTYEALKAAGVREIGMEYRTSEIIRGSAVGESKKNYC